MRIYVDGVQKATGTPGALGITGSQTLSNLTLAGYTGGTNNGWGGTIENWKHYNTFKTDFSDRENQRAGMNDLKIIS
jgi:hypothetical protein